MALITCEECSAQISEKAAGCPNCGAPRALPAAPKTEPIGGTPVLKAAAFMRPVQTIEKTGKGYKAWQLLGAVAVFFGLIGKCSTSSKDEAFLFWDLLFTGGLLAFVIARTAAWWNHG